MTMLLPLDEICLTEGPPLNVAVLAFIEFMQHGGEPPPIKVVWINSMWRVVDGRHRWTAHKLLGRTTIVADVLQITGDDLPSEVIHVETYEALEAHAGRADLGLGASS